MLMMQQVTNTGGGGSLEEISSFIKAQREEAKAERAETEARQDAKDLRMEQQRKEMDAKMEQQRIETEARLDAKDTKMEQMRLETQAKIEQELAALKAPAQAITDEQLAALQARIEGLHATKLLADDELFALEDLLADYVELTVTVADGVITKDMIYAMPTVAVASKVDNLVSLSAAMAGDAAFARQARRKFL